MERDQNSEIEAEQAPQRRRASDRAEELVEGSRDSRDRRKGARAGPRRIVGIRASALLEIALFVGVILVIDQFMMRGNGMAHIAPHPFWLVVLLLASQYGSKEGLTAATICSAVMLLAFTPARDPTVDLYDYLLGVAYRPLLWFVAAVLFGELRTRQVRERDDLKRSLEESIERNRVVAAAYERMEEIKRRLEVRLAGQFRTAVSMYEAAKSVEAMEPALVLTGALENVRAVLAPAKCSIYLMTGDRLEAGIQFGWEPDDRFKRTFTSDSALFREIVTKERVLCVADPEDETVLEGSGLIAGPVVNPETGEVRAMIKIEDTGFLNLNLSTIELFRVLCEWVGSLYANAQRYRAQEAERSWDSKTQLYAPHFYPRYRALMDALIERGGIEVTELRANIRDVMLLGRDERRTAALAFGTVAGTALRDTDFAFGADSGKEEFILVLSATSVKGARVVAGRIQTAFRAALPADLKDIVLNMNVVELADETVMLDPEYVRNAGLLG